MVRSTLELRGGAAGLGSWDTCGLGFLQACASRRGVPVLQPAEGGLTLLQPAARLHHQPALCLGQLLAEQLMPGLHVPQPLLPALSQPQLRTDAPQALDSRGWEGWAQAQGRPTPQGLPAAPALAILPPPSRSGQAHSGASKVGMGRSWAPQVRLKPGAPKAACQGLWNLAQDRWACMWEPPSCATPGNNGGGLRAPPVTPLWVQGGHQGPPWAQGRFLPSPHPGRAVDRGKGEVSRLPGHTARGHPALPEPPATGPDLGQLLPWGWAVPLQTFHVINLVHLDLKGLLQ